ncbi:MAG: hypothetical protein L0Z50_17215 [Verrucomicrobiales bacterium]|nr:hypothetical protein [Verrucomicrobiales bacterium]
MNAFVATGAALSVVWLSNALAAGLDNLNVIYVGEATNTTRATEFLQKNVGRLEAVSRQGFKQEQANSFDVVVLDWPQSDKTEQERQQGSPLGARASWTKPTVLLGSAGLNQAIVWKVRGGSG